MLVRHRDIPLNRDASARLLPALVTVMVYLAALAVVSAMAMHKIASRWDSGLAGSLTIQMPLAEEGTVDTPGPDPEAALEVLDLLDGMDSVREARVLSNDEVTRLLEPWLGTTGSATDLPLPQLIAVTLNTGDKDAVARLTHDLQAAVPGIIVEDHEQWLGNLLNLAYSIEMIALAVVILVCFSAVLMVVTVTRMGLAVHQQIIELLHLIGAHDSYVAAQFQRHALMLGLRGGMQGLILAVPTVLLLGHLIGRTEAALLPELSLSPYEWAVLALLPLTAAGLTMVTARITVLRRLGSMP